MRKTATLLILLPLVVLVIWSFAKNWPWPLLLPEEWGFRGWNYLANPRTRAWPVLFRSIGISLSTVLLTLILCVPAARALAFYTFPGKKWIEIFLYAPIFVPATAIGMGVHIAFLRAGLANTVAGVVLIHIFPCIPYAVYLLRSAFTLIGAEIEQQARVLGANSFHILWHITLPMLFPSLLTAGSLLFIVSFSQYFLTFLIGGGRIVTFPMLMIPFIQSGDRTTGSVFSLVFLITAAAVVLFSERILAARYRKRYGEKEWQLYK